MVEPTATVTTQPAGEFPLHAEIPFYPFTGLAARLRPAAQCQRAWLQFTAQRWRKDMDTLIQLACCGSAAELLCVQYEAAADAAADYLGVMHRLLPGPQATRQPAGGGADAGGG